MRLWSKQSKPYVRHSRRFKLFALGPPTILSLGFMMLIAIGTLLLSLPIASTATTSFIDALFTATSAVTVTGLVVVDTGTHFTVFGQMVIALLIQAGGIGFMTFGVLAAISVGARLGISQQLVAREALGQTSLDKVSHTAKLVVLYSLVIQIAGWMLLTLVWYDEKGLRTSAYDALFYTISAFNNAGFALSADSLSAYSSSISITLIISGLFIIGGIGFTILFDVLKHRRWKSLSVNTRVIIITTFSLNFSAFGLIWLLEANNPATLGLLSTGDQALAAWFQAVTPRTAGFNTLPTHALTDATTTLTLFLMFIGGGSMSTASGIKLGTFVILVMATYSSIRRRNEVLIMNRRVEQDQVMKALSLTIVSIFSIFTSIFVLSVLEKAPFIDIVFEVVSAISTVGLSRGITGQLSDFSKLVLCLIMLIGRVGPLTFAYFLATPSTLKIRYPKSNIQIG